MIKKSTETCIYCGSITRKIHNSPNLNSIKNCWFTIKKYLRTQEYRNSRGLNQAINEAIDLVADKNMAGLPTVIIISYPIETIYQF